ncbi:unnamed protein product, partial [Dibothriocephalus latus]
MYKVIVCGDNPELTRRDFKVDPLNRATVNPKHFYSYLRQSTKTKDPIPLLRTAEGIDLIEDEAKADHFPEFFRSAFIKETTYDYPADDTKVDTIIETVQLAEALVLKEILDLVSHSLWSAGGMDKKKKKLKGDVYEDPLKPSAFEIEVANYLHNNLPSLDGKLSGCRVSIFYPADAVELLTKSQWSKFKLKNKPNESAQFSSEESAVRFMTKMLEKNMISRYVFLLNLLKVSYTFSLVQLFPLPPQNEAGEQHDSETDKVESKSSPTESSSSPAEKSGETKSKKSASAGDSFLGLPFFSTAAPK